MLWIHIVCFCFRFEIFSRCLLGEEYAYMCSRLLFGPCYVVVCDKLRLCLCILLDSSFVYTCVCIFLHIQSPLRECHSIRSGASGLLYYCRGVPLVCVSEVIELLTVWQYNKPKTKKEYRHWQANPSTCGVLN